MADTSGTPTAWTVDNVKQKANGAQTPDKADDAAAVEPHNLAKEFDDLLDEDHEAQLEDGDELDVDFGSDDEISLPDETDSPTKPVPDANTDTLDLPGQQHDALDDLSSGASPLELSFDEDPGDLHLDLLPSTDTDPSAQPDSAEDAANGTAGANGLGDSTAPTDAGVDEKDAHAQQGMHNGVPPVTEDASTEVVIDKPAMSVDTKRLADASGSGGSSPSLTLSSLHLSPRSPREDPSMSQSHSLSSSLDNITTADPKPNTAAAVSAVGSTPNTTPAQGQSVTSAAPDLVVSSPAPAVTSAAASSSTAATSAAASSSAPKAAAEPSAEVPATAEMEKATGNQSVSSLENVSSALKTNLSVELPPEPVPDDVAPSVGAGDAPEADEAWLNELPPLSDEEVDDSNAGDDSVVGSEPQDKSQEMLADLDLNLPSLSADQLLAPDAGQADQEQTDDVQPPEEDPIEPTVDDNQAGSTSAGAADSVAPEPTSKGSQVETHATSSVAASSTNGGWLDAAAVSTATASSSGDQDEHLGSLHSMFADAVGRSGVKLNARERLALAGPAHSSSTSSSGFTNLEAHQRHTEADKARIAQQVRQEEDSELTFKPKTTKFRSRRKRGDFLQEVSRDQAERQRKLQEAREAEEMKLKKLGQPHLISNPTQSTGSDQQPAHERLYDQFLRQQELQRKEELARKKKNPTVKELTHRKVPEQVAKHTANLFKEADALKRKRESGAQQALVHSQQLANSTKVTSTSMRIFRRRLRRELVSAFDALRQQDQSKGSPAPSSRSVASNASQASQASHDDLQYRDTISGSQLSQARAREQAAERARLRVAAEEQANRWSRKLRRRQMRSAKKLLKRRPKSADKGSSNPGHLESLDARCKALRKHATVQERAGHVLPHASTERLFERLGFFNAALMEEREDVSDRKGNLHNHTAAGWDEKLDGPNKAELLRKREERLRKHILGYLDPEHTGEVAFVRLFAFVDLLAEHYRHRALEAERQAKARAQRLAQQQSVLQERHHVPSSPHWLDPKKHRSSGHKSPQRTATASASMPDNVPADMGPHDALAPLEGLIHQMMTNQLFCRPSLRSLAPTVDSTHTKHAKSSGTPHRSGRKMRHNSQDDDSPITPEHLVNDRVRVLARIHALMEWKANLKKKKEALREQKEEELKEQVKQFAVHVSTSTARLRARSDVFERLAKTPKYVSPEERAKMEAARQEEEAAKFPFKPMNFHMHYDRILQQQREEAAEQQRLKEHRRQGPPLGPFGSQSARKAAPLTPQGYEARRAQLARRPTTTLVRGYAHRVASARKAKAVAVPDHVQQDLTTSYALIESKRRGQLSGSDMVDEAPTSTPAMSVSERRRLLLELSASKQRSPPRMDSLSSGASSSSSSDDDEQDDAGDISLESPPGSSPAVAALGASKPQRSPGTRPVLFHVDVKLSKAHSDRISVHDGEDHKVVAERFARKHRLNSAQTELVAGLLAKQMSARVTN